MQPFRFRLRRVLDWQAKACRIEEQKMAACRLAVHDADERLARLKAAFFAAEQQMKSQAALAASDLASWARYRREVTQTTCRLQTNRQGLAAALEQQVIRFNNERRKLRQLETLRDHALRAYTAEAGRELETLALESHLATRHHATLLSNVDSGTSEKDLLPQVRNS